MENSGFIIERLIGAFAYCSSLFFFIYRVNNAQNIDQVKKKLYTYAIVLAVMAFFYCPNKEADVARLHRIGEIWVNQGWDTFYKNTLLSSSTPVACLLIYLCSMTHIDGLLPAISALVYYLNIFSVISIIAKHKTKNMPRVASILVFIVMSTATYLSVISGIRTTMAFSIIARCYFEETYNNKSMIKHIPLYLLAILMHSTAIPLVLLRLFVMSFSKSKNALVKIVQIIMVVILFVAFMKYGEVYLNTAMDKMEGFSSSVVYMNYKAYYSSIFRFVVYLAFIVSYLKKPWNKNRGNGHVLFLLSLVCIEILFIRSFVIFARFIGFLTILMLPIIADYICPYIKNIENTEKIEIGYSDTLYNRFMFICIVFLILSYLAGDLSAYKFMYL